ncbi:MAG: phosphatase PAP2 family protein [Clostridiales bacterium]|jgi:membrane-associated phospholipid phosphatase|nr:phosphatase PAP2 family protein [Clostridiales bacterium]
MTGAIFNFDALILLFIQEHLRNEFLDPLVVFITRLGDNGIMWILLSLALLIPKKTRGGGFETLMCLLLAFLINDLILKDLFARIRPYELIEGLTILVPPETSFSFPSGHTNASFACATALTLSFGKKGAWAYIPAAAISLSRLYVGVHYPTDVLGGILVGTLAAFAAHYLLKRFLKANLISKDKT